MALKNTRIMQQFVPEVLYKVWVDAHGIDIERYPYMKMDWDDKFSRKMPYAVFATEQLYDDEGRALKWFIVRYKALYSKNWFDVTIYL